MWTACGVKACLNGDMNPGILLRSRRYATRHRRPLAGLLTGAAVLLLFQFLIPAPDAGQPALVAAADLPAGHTLAQSDLATIELPAGLVPPDHFRPGQPGPAGSRLAVPILAGSLVTNSALVGPGLLAGAPAGSVAVPVRPSDPSTVRLVGPGQHVNVVLSSDTGLDRPAATKVLARNVTVLWTSDIGGSSGAWPGTNDDGGLVVVAARPEVAAELAAAAHLGQVFLVLVD